ncbi:MAG: hypothetical protein ACE5G2_10185 [Candidatus Krumholzibacteriia bacterium]
MGELDHRCGHEPEGDGESDGDIALEIAVIIFALVRLYNWLGIDLSDAFARETSLQNAPMPGSGATPDSVGESVRLPSRFQTSTGSL